MIRIIQVNMHQSATAHQLLAQFAAEIKVDLVLIREQGRGVMAFRLIGYRCHLISGWASTSCSCSFFNVYLMPNEKMPDFQYRHNALEDVISDTEGQILVGSEFNDRAIEWGLPQLDSEGKRILEIAARTGLVVLNTNLFQSLASPVYGWRVLEDLSASHHQYIAFEVVDATCWRAPTRHAPCLGMS